MPNLKLGDTVSIKLKNNEVVSAYEDSYNEIVDLTIVGIAEAEYFLFVPPFSCLKHTTQVNERNYKKMGLYKRYINDDVIKIQHSDIYRVKNILNGTCCARCETFCQYGFPEIEGDFFLCYSCKQNPYR